MRLFKRKKKFIFEFSECDMFFDKEIYDPHDLVKHMIDEDNRFRQDYHEGTILISKIKNDINGKVYYAERFHLPKKEGFDWYEALSPFFAKKPQEFKLEGNEVNQESEQQKEDHVAYTLDQFEETSESESEENDSEIEPEKNEEEQASETLESNDIIQLSKSELDALQAAVLDQKKELNYLRAKMSGQDLAESNVTISELTKSSSINTTTANTEEIVPTVLQNTKIDLNQALSDFVATETEKIEAEIQKLDKRNQIEFSLTQQLQAEEQEQLVLLSQQLEKEKEQSIQEENLRHQECLKNINDSFANQEKEKTEAIQLSFRKKLNSSIKEEYDKQTEQLSRILQGKMDELQLRQQTMNEGLKANFKEALDSFNLKHNQVIQRVERKKEGTPLELDKEELKQA